MLSQTIQALDNWISNNPKNVRFLKKCWKRWNKATVTDVHQVDRSSHWGVFCKEGILKVLQNS